MSERAPSALLFTTRGLYYGHSSTATMDYCLSDVQHCAEHYLNPVPSKHSGYFGWSVKSENTPLDLHDLDPILVSGHERHHFRQMLSTSCGLLVWRILQSITSALGYVVKKLKNTTLAGTLSLPLLDWYRSTGKQEIIAAFANLPDPREVVPRLTGVDPRQYAAMLPGYLDSKLSEVAILLDFLGAVQGDAKLSMKRFVDLANNATRLLAKHNGLAPGLLWAARNPDATTYLPEQGFTLTEILEADARLVEDELLRQFRVGSKLKSDWRQHSIFGIYQRVYDWILAELGDVFISRAAIDVSLLGPVDLSCAEAVSGIAFVEDSLPAWRLAKAVEAIKNSFWPGARSAQELEVRKGIAARACIPPPDNVVSAALSRPLLERSAWTADMRLNDIPEDVTPVEYLFYCEDEIRRGLSIRNEDYLAFLHPEVPDVFQPLIEFYKDTALFHGSPGVTCSPAIHLKAFHTLALNLALLSLIGEGDVTDLLKIQRSFSNRMKELIAKLNPQELASVGDLSSIEQMWDVRTIASNALGESISSRLRW